MSLRGEYARPIHFGMTHSDMAMSAEAALQSVENKSVDAQLALSIRIFSVTLAERSHPFPFRTRQLSSLAPMVLHGRLCGRVGRCRVILEAPGRLDGPGFLVSGCFRRQPDCLDTPC